ncbi:hypothetical protein OROGR_029977 [Orobanche gracilis]
MGDLFVWLISFLIVIALIGMILYQLMCLADLEYDYINMYDSASRINMVVLPEFVAQGVSCLLHLITGHWVMFLLCVPYAYYNVTLMAEYQKLQVEQMLLVEQIQKDKDEMAARFASQQQHVAELFREMETMCGSLPPSF